MTTATQITIEYQVSDHGAGKKSAQFFERPSGKLIEDNAVVKDVNGWRVVGDQRYDTPQFATPVDAAAHYAFRLLDRLS